jgi:hypothetical protein
MKEKGTAGCRERCFHEIVCVESDCSVGEKPWR